MVSFHWGTIWITHMEQKPIMLQWGKNKQSRCTCKIKSAPTPELPAWCWRSFYRTQNWLWVTFPRGLTGSQRWSLPWPETGRGTLSITWLSREVKPEPASSKPQATWKLQPSVQEHGFQPWFFLLSDGFPPGSASSSRAKSCQNGLHGDNKKFS